MGDCNHDPVRIKVAIVTNIPAPYRVPVYNCIASYPGIDLYVIYGSHKEPDRQWDLPELKFNHCFLENKVYELKNRFIHLGAGVAGKLREFNPDVVITTGFNPLHLLSFWWAYKNKKINIVKTDGTFQSEQKLGFLHKMVRDFVYSKSQAFVSATDGGVDLYRSYDIPLSLIYRSPLCHNSSVTWPDSKASQRDIDIIFSGRMVQVKNPQFAIQVAQKVAVKLRRRIRMAMLGHGSLLDSLKDEAKIIAPDVDIKFTGNVSQSDVPKYFSRAKIFVFPTLWDPWGVVVNEAFAAGVPVISSGFAGAAGELVVDNVSGYVLDLDIDQWVNAASELLVNDLVWQRMSESTKQLVSLYTAENAALGIIDAVRHAYFGANSVDVLNPFPRFSYYGAQSLNRERRVVIVQRRLTHYRIPLFERLRSDLSAKGIRLSLVYGNGTASELKKNDSGSLGWGQFVAVRYFFGGNVALQFGLDRYIKGNDLVVITQENKLINNFYFIYRRLFSGERIAFWGHGRNFQGDENTVLEYIKEKTTTMVDWWFAYTDISERVVKKSGFPVRKITVLNNSIDTYALSSNKNNFRSESRPVLRYRLGIGDGMVGIYIGSLYSDKRIDWILKAGEELSRRCVGFKLVIVGDGVLRPLVEDCANKNDWLIYFGPKHGLEKAEILYCADFLINPGLVGLSVLDAFAAGLPVVTSAYKKHSPEISYVIDGVNALISKDDLDSYISSCIDLIQKPDSLSRLKEGAKKSGNDFSIENMSARFADGIVQALEVRKVRPLRKSLLEFIAKSIVVVISLAILLMFG